MTFLDGENVTLSQVQWPPSNGVSRQVMESIKAAEEELETAKKEAEDDGSLLLLLYMSWWKKSSDHQLRLVVFLAKIYRIFKKSRVKRRSFSVSPTSSLNLQDLQEYPLCWNHPAKIPQLPSGLKFVSQFQELKKGDASGVLDDHRTMFSGGETCEFFLLNGYNSVKNGPWVNRPFVWLESDL